MVGCAPAGAAPIRFQTLMCEMTSARGSAAAISANSCGTRTARANRPPQFGQGGIAAGVIVARARINNVTDRLIRKFLEWRLRSYPHKARRQTRVNQQYTFRPD